METLHRACFQISEKQGCTFKLLDKSKFLTHPSPLFRPHVRELASYKGLCLIEFVLVLGFILEYFDNTALKFNISNSQWHHLHQYLPLLVASSKTCSKEYQLLSTDHPKQQVKCNLATTVKNY